MITDDLKFGATLPNGATVLDWRLDRTLTGGIVLAHNGKEFVTWQFFRDDMATTSWGHYCGGLHEAVVDMVNRYSALNSEN